ncbi:hypothetical protein THIOM_004954, partial [Candidatus Thiomargarita nelsonii]
MADVDVSFMHPTDGQLLTVQLDDTITAQEVIAELLSQQFVPSHPDGYEIYPKSEDGN